MERVPSLIVLNSDAGVPSLATALESVDEQPLSAPRAHNATRLTRDLFDMVPHFNRVVGSSDWVAAPRADRRPRCSDSSESGMETAAYKAAASSKMLRYSKFVVANV